MTARGPLVFSGMTDGAREASDVDFREVVRWSTGGNRWLMLLRSPPGKSLDRFVVRWVGWSLITWGYAKAAGNPYQPALLLQTIGRRSGVIRTAVLPYYPVDDELVVCGSNGGGPKDPMWVHNVRSDGHCWLRIKRRLLPADAHVATDEERHRLFPIVSGLHPGLQRYQDQASTYGRDVPLVVLTRRRTVR
jgi:F420H(2)-dependent quinone reductase